MVKKLLGLVGAVLLLAIPSMMAASATSGGLVKASGGEALPVVPAGERSKHFDAVTRQLELGGTLFGYVDIDGDPAKVVGFLDLMAKSMAEEQPSMAALKQDYGAIFSELGFNDVKAAGFSSVHAGNGRFRNRVFVYAPEGRHGLLAGLGGKPAPFKHLKLAPANADFYAEGEIDLPAVYNAVLNIVTRVGGTATANAMEAHLLAAGKEVGISALGIIQRLKGHVAAVVRLDASAPIQIPGRTPFQIPNVSLLLRIDGIAGQLAPLLEQTSGEQGPFARIEAGGRVIFEFKGDLPVGELKPVIVIEGDDLMIATNRKFFDACVAADGRLAEAPQFREVLQGLGSEGNGLFYFAPSFVKQLLQLKELNQDAPPEVRNPLALGLSQLKELEFPLVGIRVNRDDGVLFASTMNRSLKQDLAALAIYNPVTVGLLASMAIPAFNKVRTNSIDKTIQNNLRMLEAAGEQHCLEQGVDTATYEQLVGPGKMIEELTPVAGEDYTKLVFKVGETLSVETAAGKTIRTRDE